MEKTLDLELYGHASECIVWLAETYNNTLMLV